MIKQPVKDTRNVSTSFFEAETRRIKRLNETCFDDVKLTQEENEMLVWLCGWDERTVEAIISAFSKSVRFHDGSEVYNTSVDRGKKQGFFK